MPRVYGRILGETARHQYLFLSRYLNFGSNLFNTNREINAAPYGRVFAARSGSDGGHGAKAAPSGRAFKSIGRMVKRWVYFD
jgi:hypothetical protein